VNVDVVPGAGFATLAADVVGPGAGSDEVVAAFSCAELQEPIRFRLCARCQTLVGDVGDDHVAGVDPSLTGGGKRREHAKGEGASVRTHASEITRY